MFALLVLGLLLWAAPAQTQQDIPLPPSPVTNVALTSGDQSVTVTWGPPDDSGSSPVTAYYLDCKEGPLGTWRTEILGGDARSHTITHCTLALQNGTTYDFRVYAGNAQRYDSSAATIHSIKVGLPAAPTGLTATAGNQQVTLSWTAGSDNGSAITQYQYQQNGGSWAAIANSGASTTSHTVTGLTKGTEYKFKVRAKNTHGDGAASAEVKATPVGPPEQPTGLTATDGDQQVTLSWTAPANNGGSAITEWDYQQDGGSWTAIANSGADTTSHTVTGLTNGTEYTFKVRAVNTHGDGAESAAKKATPATTPAAPTGLSATDTDQASGAVKLTWTAPTTTGGSAITGYKYSKDNGTNWSTTGTTTASYTATGLTNGTAYTFKVRAVNRKGDGTASAAATATPTTVPSAPRSLTAAPTSGQVRQVALSWTAPANTGGAAITGYEYQQNEGSWTGAGTTTSYTVTGLTNGTKYTFTVRAVNRKGNGAASDSASATTPTTPDAPTNLSATDADQEVTLSWTAPTETGGLAITGYQYSQDDGENWTAVPNSNATTTSYTVDSLTNGTEYTFKVRAVNAAGEGAASAAVTATPATTPDAPTLTVIASNKQVRLSWTAGSNNGAAITEWEYQQNGGSWQDIPNSGADTTSYLVTDLTNGTEYTFTVRAVNRKGEGAASAAVPATPGAFTATAGNGQVTLRWPVPAGNPAITGWQYRYKKAGESYGSWTDIEGSNANTTSHTVTGLENGTEYTFQLQALNQITPVVWAELLPVTPQTAGVQSGGGGVVEEDDPETVLQGVFESPANGATVAGIDVIRGWSFAETAGVGIAQVELFLNNRPHAVIPCCSARPDVADEFPSVPAANAGQSGWGITQNWGNLAAGSHTLQVRVTSTDGQRRVLGPHRVTVVKPGDRAYLDRFSVAAAEARLEAGRLVLDGVLIRDKATQAEQEIEARYAWQGSAQGLRLVTSRTLEVAQAPTLAIDRLLAGLWAWLRPGSVNANPAVERVYEAPPDQAEVAGIGLIRGWAFPVAETDTVAGVVVDIDAGAVRESAPCCSTRGDVADEYPGQANAEMSGWGLVFNYGRLPEGEHDIAVRIATEAGLEAADTHTVTVSRLGGYEFVDRFDLSAAEVDLEGEEIILSGVEVRDSATQATQTIEVGLRWSRATQGLVIVDTESLPFHNK